jgi:hypothetical protein
VIHEHPEQNPFRVLRVIPHTPLDAEDQIVAKLDLIDVDHDLLLFDCELQVDDDFGEVFVEISDLRVLLRYFLEPGFCGEIDFGELSNERKYAVCRHFGLADYAGETSNDVLYEFLRSPRWPQWLREHHPVPSAKQAVLDFVAAR